MNEELERLRAMVGTLLAQKQLPTKENIREEITRIRRACPSVVDEEAEELALYFEHIHGVTMDIGPALEGDSDFEKWLEDARADIDFYYWNRYKKLLAEKNLAGQVLATMDQVTDRILGLLENPKKEGGWDRRGMVVGSVQSGKTANYIGLVNKAADAGYRVIIIIAGIQNKLRSQTQSRIDEGFAGIDSSSILKNRLKNRLRNRNISRNIIGVGKYGMENRPSLFTNTMGDFNKETARSVGIPLENLRTPAVFVIKKNYNTLGNLIEWLKEHNAQRGTSSITEPLLLVDDEADNASINTRTRQNEVSRINGQIRQLLNIFDRSGYVGYTATPFANIFIDPDTDDEMFRADLFPRDFIIGLDPPDNYFGAARVFLPSTGEDEESHSPIVRHIEDNEDILPQKHKKDHRVETLPNSLGDAVRAFIIARAIRLSRGQVRTHNSMLVNISPYTDVQGHVRNTIHIFVEYIKDSVRVNASIPAGEAVLDPEIASLKRVFDREYCNTGVIWEEVQGKLLESIAAINAVEINSRSSDGLNYDEYPKGLNVIAVGGYSLSRGLTLEGLVVSYFLRNSMMYDTLMQMGRWFGYRRGYEDLCRVWMPEEAEGWYAHIAESIEELRDELRRMEAAGATPREFGLKVRSHPDTLIVTARNRMGSGQQRTFLIGLANQFVETIALYKDKKINAQNHAVAINLGESLQKIGMKPEKIKFGNLFKKAPVKNVLDFVRAFKNHPMATLTDTNAVCQYIKDRECTELSEWDVLFAGRNNNDGKTPIDRNFDFEIICQRRKEGKRSQGKKEVLIIGEKQHVASRGIEAAGLSEKERKEVEKGYAEEKNRNKTSDTEKKHRGANDENINYPDNIYRRIRERPLLIIHLLVIGEKEDNLKDAKPVVAYGISFPKTEYEEKKVEYIVTPTWMREHYSSEADEDEGVGDDDY